MNVPPDLLARIRVQDGVVTTGQALELGLDGRDVGRLRGRGALKRIRWGAYALRSDWDAWDDRARHLALARAVSMQLGAPFTFSHLTAAVVHDLPLHRGDLSEVHVTRADGARLTKHQAGVWHHDGPAGEVVEVGGLRVTSLARTAFDVARVVDLHAGVVTADAALARGISEEVLAGEADRASHWPGSAAARRVVQLADGRSESPGETLTRLALRAVGLPPDTLQLEVMTDQGLARTDFGWVEHGVVGEFDGRIKYGRLLRPGQEPSDVVVAERQRELAIERAGWKVVRFIWSEIRDPGLVRQRLLDAFDRPAPGRMRRRVG